MGLIFDYTSGKWVDLIDDYTAIDQDGNILYRDGDHLLWDPEEEEYHDTEGWDE